MSKKPPTAACTCSKCRHRGAAIFREHWRSRLAPGRTDAELEESLTDRWHEYHDRQRELDDALPQHATHQTYHGVKETPALQGLLDWYSGERDDDDSRNIAVASGPHGTGKTLAMVYVALHRMALDEPVFVTAHKLARHLRDKETRSSALRRCLEAGALLIDDLGKEAQSSSFARDLDEIVDTVYQGYTQLVITTNLTAKAFRDRYGESVADRVRERGRWIPCTGKSMRGAR